MAKKAYIGVGGVARKVKKMYVGAETDVPVYGQGTVNVDANNIWTFFKVENGVPYYFAGSGNVFTTNNAGKNNSTAITTLTAINDMTLNFTYSYSSEKNYDKFTLTIAGTVVENGVSGPTTTKTWSGTLSAGQSIEFKYSKDSSSGTNDDKCTFSAMTAVTLVQTGTETRPAARKIKKGYIGVGGVARPFFTGGELAYYGAITGPMGPQLAATTVGNYALFGGGGEISGSNYSAVYAYDSSLTQSQPESLSAPRNSLAATTIGGYALFGGGRTSNPNIKNEVDAYDAHLTRSTAANLSLARSELAATTVGNYAIFGGGYRSAAGGDSTVDAYDASLTRTSPMKLIIARNLLAATTIGNYALFGGGAVELSQMDAYDASLTRSTPTALSVGRDDLAATTIGNYALFGGGGSAYNGTIGFDTVDAYDTSLTRTTPAPMSVARKRLAATTVGDYALFGGGVVPSPWKESDVVDAYDSSLTRTIPTALSYARPWLAATTLGNYALFGGGSGYKTIMDVYVVA